MNHADNIKKIYDSKTYVIFGDDLDLRVFRKVRDILNSQYHKEIDIATLSGVEVKEIILDLLNALKKEKEI